MLSQTRNYINASQSDTVPVRESQKLAAPSQAFGWFAWAVLLFNLLVIGVGVVVRATGSGDGCGAHWPACDGEIIPVAPTVKKMIEYTHRLV
ncbi:MAG: COX15/CtaA family protein, partial [Armatimonadota bacterium]